MCEHTCCDTACRRTCQRRWKACKLQNMDKTLHIVVCLIALTATKPSYSEQLPTHGVVITASNPASPAAVQLTPIYMRMECTQISFIHYQQLFSCIAFATSPLPSRLCCCPPHPATFRGFARRCHHHKPLSAPRNKQYIHWYGPVLCTWAPHTFCFQTIAAMKLP